MDYLQNNYVYFKCQKNILVPPSTKKFENVFEKAIEKNYKSEKNEMEKANNKFNMQW